MAELVKDPTVPGPVLMNEDFNGYGTGQANVDAERESAGNVFRAGGSWGHMWQPYNQKYPFRWAVGAGEDVSGGDEANRFRGVLNGINALLQPDGTAPSIGERLPLGSGVSTSASVVATFSEPMDPGSVSTATFILSRGGVPVDARVGISPSGDHATLTPTSPLLPSTTYTATLTGGVADSSGNPVTSGATWSFTTGAAHAAGAGPFQASSSQLVVEGEGYSRKAAAAGHDWVAGQSPAGSVGGALFAGPDDGFGVSGDPRGTAPTLDYDVTFPRAGAYRVWVRGYQPSASSNSVSVSLDGLHPKDLESENMSSPVLGEWTWIGKRVGSPFATVIVPTPGQHTLQVSLREDGFHLDRLLLVRDSVGDDLWVPTGDGPAASPRA